MQTLSTLQPNPQQDLWQPLTPEPLPAMLRNARQAGLNREPRGTQDKL